MLPRRISVMTGTLKTGQTLTHTHAHTHKRPTQWQLWVWRTGLDQMEASEES